VKSVCTRQTFRPVDGSRVRWLNTVADYEIARTYWQANGLSLSSTMWEQAHKLGYRYVAITTDGEIVSCAAVWQFSNEVWAVAAVGTLPGFRRRGFSRAVVSFVTGHILEAGRIAVIETGDDNRAMAATAKSVGFQHVSLDRVWWTYPETPDTSGTVNGKGKNDHGPR
jgi:GNAT superfamily N-acetyltransferase